MKPYEVFTVNGKDYSLKMTTAHAVLCEEELGKSILDAFNDSDKLSVLSVLYYHCIAGNSQNIRNIEDVYMLFDDYFREGGNTDDLKTKMLDALVTSGVLSKAYGDFSKNLLEKQKAFFQKSLTNYSETQQKQESVSEISGN